MNQDLNLILIRSTQVTLNEYHIPCAVHSFYLLSYSLFLQFFLLYSFFFLDNSYYLSGFSRERGRRKYGGGNTRRSHSKPPVGEQRHWHARNSHVMLCYGMVWYGMVLLHIFKSFTEVLVSRFLNSVGG